MWTNPEPTVKGVMLWAEFTARLEYLKCRPNHRAWIRAYLETGSEVIATEQTYHCANHLSAYSLSYQVRNAARVRAALECWFGTSKQMLLEDTHRLLLHAVPGSIAAQRLSSRLHTLILGTKAEPYVEENSKPQAAASQAPAPASIPPASVDAPKRFKVGDRVTERDEAGVLHTGVVTAVDTDGQITGADELPS